MHPDPRSSLTVLFILLGLITGAGLARADPGAPLTDAGQRAIVDAYTDHRCVDVWRLVRADQVDGLRPNVMAVVASCDLPGVDSEALFAKAERADPHGDLILALHALHRQGRDPESAKPIWKNTLMLARNEYLREISKEYLSGQRVAPRSLNLSSLTLNADLDLGASYHSQPWFEPLPSRPSRASAALDFDLRLKAQRWLRFGSLSAELRETQTRYFSAREQTLVTHRAALPLAVRVGRSEDLHFTPFYRQSMVGGQGYQDQYGFALSGVVYRDTYKQSVSGYVSAEDNNIGGVGPSVQSHYHFDYQWEFFPERWLLSGMLAMDDISADRTASLDGHAGDFNNSHVRLEVDGLVRRGFGWVSLGVEPRLAGRFDNHESAYLDSAGTTVRERRVDWALELEPHALFKLAPQLQLRAYYRWSSVRSNVGAGDYVDRSHTEHVGGVLLKTYWSSY